jgi:integrase
MRQKLTSVEIAKRKREGRYHDGRQPLNVKKVAKLKGEGRYKDGLMPGLYLQVSKTGTKSWLLRYELNGSPERWMGLGPAVAFTLSEARQRARIARQQLADGVDPLKQKRAQRAAEAAAALKTITFKEAAAAYLEAHQAKWRSAKHGHQWISSLQRFVYPIIGALDVAAVDVPAVLQVLEQKVPASLGNPAGALWTARSVTADRVRNRIELILSWAAGRGHRSGDNPAAWGRLKHILPAPAKVARVVHHAAVPYADMPALIAELHRREGVSSKALAFLILTAGRVGEVLGATWDEIDFDTATWTVPAARMKSGREHKVPLSPAAIEQLRSLYREDGNQHLFIGPRNERLSNAALVAALRRLRRSETVHGMRSAFSDWAHERTSHANHTIELSLAHSVGGAVERAYRRGEMFEKRRKLMGAWSTYCTSPPVLLTDNIVTMGGR